MSKKINPTVLLLLLGLFALVCVAFIGYQGLQKPTPTPTTTQKAPFQPGHAVQSPNKVDKVVVGQIIVKFKPQYTDAQIADHLKQYHASVSRKIDGVGQTVVKVPAGQEDTVTQKLQADGYVDSAQRDYTTHALYAPNDQGFNSQWALNNTGQTIQGKPGTGNDDIRAVTAWNVSQGAGVKVAILDTGINLNHPDLAGKVVAQKVFTGTSIEDNNGHGTHVAGIIAANTNNGIGVAGVCPSCQLIIGKVMDDNGDGTSSDTVAGIIWAADQGAKVINLSLGSTNPETLPIYQQAVAYANQKGAVVVAAAGNSNTSNKLYPAAVPGVISVGATDNTNNKASFSSYGSWVQIAAPGTNILSTLPDHTNAKGVLNYGYDSGTSMAGPFVAGVAALVADTQYGTSPQAIAARLYATATKINGTGTYWNSGLVNATEAVGTSTSDQPAFACVGGSGAPPCAAIPQSAQDVSTNDTTLPSGTSISPSGASGSPSPTVSLNALVGAATNSATPLANAYATPCSGVFLVNNSSSYQPSPYQSSYRQSGSGFFDSFMSFFLQIFNLMLRMTGALPPCASNTPVPTPSPEPYYQPTATPQPYYGYLTPTPAYGYPTPTPTPLPYYGYPTPTPLPYYGYPTPTPTPPAVPYGYIPPGIYPPTPTLYYAPPPPYYGDQPTPTPVPESPYGSDTTSIFNDTLAEGWSDASFDATNSFVSSPVFSGTTAISSQINANGGFDLQSVDGQFISTGMVFHFSLKASQPNQSYEIYADTTYGQPATDPISLSSYGGQPNADGWTTYDVPFADLDVVNHIMKDIVIHDATGTNQPVLYIDKIDIRTLSIPPATPITLPTISATPSTTTSVSPTTTTSTSPTPGASATPTPDISETATPTTEVSATPAASDSATPAAPTPTRAPTPTTPATPTVTKAPTPTTKPTATPTPKPTATTAPTPTPTPSIRVRKSVYDLTPTELQHLINAFNTLKQNGMYDAFAARHADAMNHLTPGTGSQSDPNRNIAHNGPAFLPWHRALLWEFEQELRKVDPTVTIPYWPFERDASAVNARSNPCPIPTSVLPKLFTAGYIGGDGNPNQGYQVTDGPFASWGITRRIGCDPAGSPTLPTQANINQMLSLTTYDAPNYNSSSDGFDEALEGYSLPGHNTVHAFVGGDMAYPSLSAKDPAFWLLHADIDRIWWEWQQSHGVTNYQPTSGGPTGHNLNDVMQLFPENFTPASVLNTQSLGYTYQ